MLRRLIAAVVIVCAATSVAAAAPRLLADLTGKWNVSIQSPDQARTSLITWTQKGDSLSGTVETELGTSQLRGVTKGDSVFFGFQLDMGGQALVINGAGAMKDKDTMNGMLELAGMGAFPFTAVRQQ
jgi:hypothetical protein